MSRTKRLKLTRHQADQLETLADLQALSRDSGALLAEHRYLSAQSLHSLFRKKLVCRGQRFISGRGWLVAYWLTRAGVAHVKRRNAGFLRQTDLEEFTGRPKRRAA